MKLTPKQKSTLRRLLAFTDLTPEPQAVKAFFDLLDPNLKRKKPAFDLAYGLWEEIAGRSRKDDIALLRQSLK